MKRSERPFARWRAHGYSRDGAVRDGIDHMTDGGACAFDECVVSLGSASSVHLEVMGERDLFLGVDKIAMNVHVTKDGSVSLRLVEGKLGDDGLIR